MGNQEKTFFKENAIPLGVVVLLIVIIVFVAGVFGKRQIANEYDHYKVIKMYSGKKLVETMRCRCRLYYYDNHIEIRKVDGSTAEWSGVYSVKREPL